MLDEQIISLFFERDERAIEETQRKYGKLCLSVAKNILHDYEDALECENDAYLSLWNAIPPEKPENLHAFLGKITRNLALKKLRARNAEKRGGGETAASLEELYECIPDTHSFDEELRAKELADLLNRFLDALPREERRVFVCRYWYCDSIAEIAKQFGFTKSKVKMMLMRTRGKLSLYLREEGVLL